jgi:hypothetical protein
VVESTTCPRRGSAVHSFLKSCSAQRMGDRFAAFASNGGPTCGSISSTLRGLAALIRSSTAISPPMGTGLVQLCYINEALVRAKGMFAFARTYHVRLMFGSLRW